MNTEIEFGVEFFDKEKTLHNWLMETGMKRESTGTKYKAWHFQIDPIDSKFQSKWSAIGKYLVHQFLCGKAIDFASTIPFTGSTKKENSHGKSNGEIEREKRELSVNMINLRLKIERILSAGILLILKWEKSWTILLDDFDSCVHVCVSVVQWTLNTERWTSFIIFVQSISNVKQIIDFFS